jgi:toxin ParE1/3/4
MASYRYRLSRFALADLEGIANYLGERNPSASDRVLVAIFHTFDRLAIDRELGSSLEGLRPGLRMLTPGRPAEKYVVIYYLVPDGVLISGVYHSARDWYGFLSRGER